MEISVYHSVVGVGLRGTDVSLALAPHPEPGLGSVRLHKVPREDSSIRAAAA